ncbi:MAG: TIR domain-containing protein [Nodosilinea sp. WJT8-NPBG4]|jgi:hypothetical protein|nr:TIR domain-containing protein [Nodosilinea sp. WJT8-NPBG4]
MAAFYDAFISYARADSKAFAIALKEQLKARGLSQLWLDSDDIPSATDWQRRIDDAIERSHHVIYIISPSAMASPYCKLELERAIASGKRIIPLLHVGGGDSAAWATHDPPGCATIRLLNWIWCRDGVDDPAQYLDKISRTLHLCDEKTGAEQPEVKAYVHQHTTLLTQALSWDRHHRQTRYLLVGSDRQAAETWLQIRFAEGEPLPCTPTDLQCEFITESIKNANNLMTQVFLCHSDEDQAAAEQIRRSLLRQGITVWNYRTDIQTSQDYNSAITGGIEEADNVLFLLSPHSAQSPYCQRELQQALDLHKRVIPVLAAPTEPELVPESLRTLQYVDLTDNSQASDYLADEGQLLKLLGTDAAHHTEHKTWLVQALKWQRQQQNPTLLLRGYNLRQAETWRAVARTHRHPPTALHEQFIAESLRQPPDSSLDVFISYSRVDSDFARRLNDALQTQGKRTWFDQESIATGTDFQQEIYRGIESSDVFVFLLSPESVNSPFCADEVEYAQGLNKRMVTVLHRPIDVADLHPVLGKLQWLDFREHDGDFQANFAGLLRTLDTDREHLETHTRLLVRSGEWDRRGRDESLLLRGQDLQTAETWLMTNAAVEPLPTGLQQEYIRASRAKQEAQATAEKKLRRGALIGALAAAARILVAAGSGVFAWTAIEAAEQRSVEANARVAEADKEVEAATLATQAATKGTRSAEQAQKQAQAVAAAAEQTAQDAENRAREADGKVQIALLAQQDADVKAQAADAKAQDAAIRARDADNKTAAAEIKQRLAEAAQHLAEAAQHLAQTLTELEGSVGSVLRQLGGNQTLALVSALETGQRLQALVNQKAQQPGAVVINQKLALTEYPSLSPFDALYQALSRIKAQEIPTRQGIVWSVSWSPDGQTLATGGDAGSVKLWRASGEAMTTLDAQQGSIRSVSWSPDGQTLATGGTAGSVKLWPNEDLNALLARGCDWLRPYLIGTPQTLQRLTVCQTPNLLRAAAPALVEDGKALAEKGRVDEAIATLQTAKQWDPSLAFEPVALANQIAEEAKQK